MYELKLPEMGEGMTEATIGRWLKQVGDLVEELEPIVELETDKVTTEVVAEVAGHVAEIMAMEGDVVPVGSILAKIEASGPATKPINQTPSQSVSTTAAELTIKEDQALRNPVYGAEPNLATEVDTLYTRQAAGGRVSPVVARMAKVHQLDLSQVAGTGKKGRITKRDVMAFIDRQAEPPPVPVNPANGSHKNVSETSHPTPTTPYTIEPLSNMRRSIAEHMQASVQNSPHATTVFEVDFSAVAAHRKAHKQAFAEKGTKLTFTAYIMLAVAQTLARQENRLVNSSWHADGLAIYNDINLGMATAIQDGGGLIVPVIQAADELNLAGMARRVNRLAHKARNNRLAPQDVKGGTFTVTNHGVSGSLFATPIINQPQCGILGVGGIVKRVIVETDRFDNDVMVIRPMAYLSFSFDHRILDGVSADRFVSGVKLALESWDER